MTAETEGLQAQQQAGAGREPARADAFSTAADDWATQRGEEMPHTAAALRNYARALRPGSGAGEGECGEKWRRLVHAIGGDRDSARKLVSDLGGIPWR